MAEALQTRIVPVTEDRVGELLEFLIETDEVIPDRAAEVWPDRIKMWWERNPFMPSGWTRGWALENEDGQIVGFFGQIPVPFQVNGKPQITHWTTAYRVAKPYRGRGEDLRQAALDHARDSIVFSNSTAKWLIYRLQQKYKLIPRWKTNVDVHRFSLMIGSGEAFMKRWEVPDPFPRLAGKLVERIQRLWLSPLFRKSAFHIRRVNRVDEQFRELWSRTRERYANTQLRTAEYVRWIMTGPPQKPKVLLGCYDDEDRLVGYLIGMKSKIRNHTSLLVIDLWVDEPREEITRTLLGGVVDYAKVYEYAVVDLFHFNDELSRWCRRWRLFPLRRSPRQDYYRVVDWDACNFQHSNSFFTREGDYVL